MKKYLQKYPSKAVPLRQFPCFLGDITYHKIELDCFKTNIMSFRVTNYTLDGPDKE